MRYFFTLALICCAAQALVAQDAAEVMKAINSQYRPKSVHALLEAEIIDRSVVFGYTVEIYLSLEESEQVQMLIVFRQPASVKNTKFLSIERENEPSHQWIYLPATRSVRRIAAGDQDESVMGTDYSFADFNFQASDDFDYEMLGEEEIDGNDAWVIQSNPPEGNVYSKIISWVDKEMMVLLKIEYYDAEGELEKVNRVEDFKRFQTLSYPTKSTMKHAQMDHQTKVTIKHIEFNVEIPDRYFTPAFLRLGR